MNIVQWQTPISGEKELYFNGLQDRGELCIYVKNQNDKEFSIIFEFCGPYLVSDEGLRTSYWNAKPGDVGWTFEVKESDIHNHFKLKEALDIDIPNSRHLVIATHDVVVEVLSNEYPKFKSYAEAI